MIFEVNILLLCQLWKLKNDNYEDDSRFRIDNQRRRFDIPSPPASRAAGRHRDIGRRSRPRGPRGRIFQHEGVRSGEPRIQDRDGDLQRQAHDGPFDRHRHRQYRHLRHGARCAGQRRFRHAAGEGREKTAYAGPPRHLGGHSARHQGRRIRLFCAPRAVSTAC